MRYRENLCACVGVVPAGLCSTKLINYLCHIYFLQIDGAARVLDPVFRGVAHGEFLSGVFLKDYALSQW